MMNTNKLWPAVLALAAGLLAFALPASAATVMIDKFQAEHSGNFQGTFDTVASTGTVAITGPDLGDPRGDPYQRTWTFNLTGADLDGVGGANDTMKWDITIKGDHVTPGVDTRVKSQWATNAAKTAFFVMDNWSGTNTGNRIDRGEILTFTPGAVLYSLNSGPDQVGSFGGFTEVGSLYPQSGTTTLNGTAVTGNGPHTFAPVNELVLDTTPDGFCRLTDVSFEVSTDPPANPPSSAVIQITDVRGGPSVPADGTNLSVTGNVNHGGTFTAGNLTGSTNNQYGGSGPHTGSGVNNSITFPVSLTGLTVGAVTGIDVDFDLTLTAGLGDDGNPDGLWFTKNQSGWAGGIWAWGVDKNRNGGSDRPNMDVANLETIAFSVDNIVVTTPPTYTGIGTFDSWVDLEKAGGSALLDFDTATGLASVTGSGSTKVRHLDFNITIEVAPAGEIPEPATLSLLAVALAGAGAYVRRRRT